MTTLIFFRHIIIIKNEPTFNKKENEMDEFSPEELAKDPKYIPGIYNYCDRWCEKCPFSSRCLNFAMEKKYYPDPESRDMENKAFWDALSRTLRDTHEMLRKEAERLGIDLDAAVSEETLEEIETIRQTAKDHKISKAAEAYWKMIDNWFKSSQSLFEGKEEELNKELQLGIPGHDPADEGDKIKEAVEVIRFYQHFIYVKLMRAIQGYLSEEQEEPDEFPRDSDGSAKIALIAIDRSMGAWGELMNRFSEEKNNVLDILVHLERLRKRVEKEFPDARGFVRPGFDE